MTTLPSPPGSPSMPRDDKQHLQTHRLSVAARDTCLSCCNRRIDASPRACTLLRCNLLSNDRENMLSAMTSRRFLLTREGVRMGLFRGIEASATRETVQCALYYLVVSCQWLDRKFRNVQVVDDVVVERRKRDSRTLLPSVFQVVLPPSAGHGSLDRQPTGTKNALRRRYNHHMSALFGSDVSHLSSVVERVRGMIGKARSVRQLSLSSLS